MRNFYLWPICTGVGAFHQIDLVSNPVIVVRRASSGSNSNCPFFELGSKCSTCSISFAIFLLLCGSRQSGGMNLVSDISSLKQHLPPYINKAQRIPLTSWQWLRRLENFTPRPICTSIRPPTLAGLVKLITERTCSVFLDHARPSDGDQCVVSVLRF